MESEVRLEPPRRRSRSARRAIHHRPQSRDPRRLRSRSLVVEGHRRHSRNHLARRLQPLAPHRPRRLLRAARLGLLLALRQDRHLRHARRAVESPRDRRRRLGQHGPCSRTTTKRPPTPKPRSSIAPKARRLPTTNLDSPITGQKIRFANVEQEQPIGELSAYYVHPGMEPTGVATLRYRLTSINRSPTTIPPPSRSSTSSTAASRPTSA